MHKVVYKYYVLFSHANITTKTTHTGHYMEKVYY